MLFNVILIASLEILAIGSFCFGFIFGRHSCKNKPFVCEKVVIDDDLLDPISPEDQQLLIKLTKGVKNNDGEEEN